MALLEEKQIAKEILIEMIRKDNLIRSEYPDTETVADMVSAAYKTILDAITDAD